MQLDDEFLWYSPTLDINVSNPGTSGALRTLVVPTNVRCKSHLQWRLSQCSCECVQGGVLFTSPDQSDDAASETTGSLWNSGAAVQITSDGRAHRWCSCASGPTPRAKCALCPQPDANCGASTVGWRDQRGRNA